MFFLKKFPLIIIAMWLAFFVVNSVAAQSAPWLYTNGIPVNSPLPVLINKSFYAPIRPVATSLGFEVGWDQAKLAAALNWQGNILEVYANSKVMIINGEPIEMIRPTILNSGTLYVPVRAFAECLGVGVTYSPITHNVYLNSSWSGNEVAKYTSPALEARVVREHSYIRVTIKNTTNVTQHAIPIVRDYAGKLDFATWIDISDGKPLTFLRPWEEYVTILSLPAWAYNTEYVEIMWVDSTKFRGRDPQTFSLLTMYLSLNIN